MDTPEYALVQTKNVESFYRQYAGKCSNAGLALILSLLAEAAARQFNALKTMPKARASLPHSNLLREAHGIFSRMQVGSRRFDVDPRQAEYCREAQQFEREILRFYQDQEQAAATDGEKEYFHALAKEAKQHIFLLDHIIEFVSRPDTWVAHAEFNHLLDED